MSKVKTPVVFLPMVCDLCEGKLRTLGCEDCEEQGFECHATVCIECGEPGPDEWDGGDEDK